MQKKTKKKFHLYTYQKVILSYFITFSICVWILYPIMYKILNYPPGAVDTQFQVEYGGLTYSQQFLFLYVAVTSLFLLFQRYVLFRKIANWERSGGINSKMYSLEEIRNSLLTAPTRFYLLQIIIPFIAITLGLGMPMVKHEIESSGITVAMLWVSIFTFNATISYVFSKNLFKPILMETFEENKLTIKRTKLSNSMMLLLLPLLIAGLFFIVIVSYSRLINVRGTDIYKYYKNEFSYIFDENTSYTQEELQQKIDSVNFINDTDTYFIIDNNKNITTSDGVPLTDFFTKYIFELSDQYDGRVYEHYAVNTQGYIKHLTVDGQPYIFGIRFPISGGDTLVYIITTFIILFGIISFLLWYYSNSLADQIKMILDGLNDINKKNNKEFKKIPIISNDELAELTIAFNKTQDLTKNNIEQLHDNQETLMEKERLASLGQLIGGIAHNLKTPIMSISGAAEGLNDLIQEYDSSIDDPEVNSQDHHDIANDMSKWVSKIKTHTEYMSDVITAVKGQAVTLSNEEDISFTVGELLKRVNILMKHELKNAIIYLNISMKTDENLIIHGDVNSLVQVINNMVSNSIQAYEGKTEQNIDLIVEKQNNNLLISVRDYGCGLPQKVKDKLFKEMITTKGKNGTGLGLYMSYSTIKAHFNGTIKVDSEVRKRVHFYYNITFIINYSFPRKSIVFSYFFMKTIDFSFFY